MTNEENMNDLVTWHDTDFKEAFRYYAFLCLMDSGVEEVKAEIDDLVRELFKDADDYDSE